MFRTTSTSAEYDHVLEKQLQEDLGKQLRRQNFNWIYHIPLHKTPIYIIAVRDNDIDNDQDYGTKQKKTHQTTQLQVQIHACTVLVFLSVFSSFIFILRQGIYQFELHTLVRKYESKEPFNEVRNKTIWLERKNENKQCDVQGKYKKVIIMMLATERIR